MGHPLPPSAARLERIICFVELDWTSFKILVLDSLLATDTSPPIGLLSLLVQCKEIYGDLQVLVFD